MKRILPMLNDVNEEWISDKTRYACDGQRSMSDKPYVAQGVSCIPRHGMRRWTSSATKYVVWTGAKLQPSLHQCDAESMMA